MASLTVASTPAPLPPSVVGFGASAVPAKASTARTVVPVARITEPHEQIEPRRQRPQPDRAEREARQPATGRNLPALRAEPAEDERVATNRFLAQLIGQQHGLEAGFGRHRDGAALGSDAYRRAGGEPALYSDQPRLLRITV